MNVLFLTHNFPRTAGDAAGSFILRLATSLRAEGVNVRVVAPAAPGVPSTDEFEGVRVDRFRYAPRKFEKLAYTGAMAQDVASSWSARLALVSFLGADFVSAVKARRTFDPDVIHAHWWFPNGVVGTWLKTLSHKPLVTTLHGTDVRLARTVPVAKPLFRHVMQHSSAVTAVSRYLADEVVKMMPGERPTVAPMPVATHVFTPDGERQPRRVLFAGRLNAQKGLEHVIRALPLTTSGVHVDVVGEGNSRDAFVALAAELGVPERLTWHGQLPQSELVGRYRSASALVMPSIEEGLGLTAVEALLCETPVVAFDSGGLTDVIHHDRTGILVAPRDHAALARALDSIVTDTETAARLGKAGRLYALANFAPESAARKYAEIYRQVLGSAEG